MRHYSIDADAPSAWQRLAICLAEDHIPGLRPWHAQIDTDRHVRILLRMHFMVDIRGFSEKSAAEAVSLVFPDLGDSESIRSIYRSANGRAAMAPWFDLFQTLLDERGPDLMDKLFSDVIGPEIDLLRAIEKPVRGRPSKK